MDQRWRDKKGDETTRGENGIGVVEGKQNWIGRGEQMSWVVRERRKEGLITQ